MTSSKFPFLAFCWVSLALIAVGAAFLSYLVYPRLAEIGPAALYSFFTAAGIFLFAVGAGLALITATSLTGVDLLYPHGRRSFALRLLFPVTVFLAKLIRYDRAKLMISFVRVNNSLTIAQSARIKGERILVLLPHCLQADACKRKVTTDLSNCAKCGGCPVGELITMGEKHGLKVEVVNGGTLARKRVASWRPHGVVAVACERDLTLGIRDVSPVPVYGVINDRPYGPCVNTGVDMDKVDGAIRFFRKGYADNGSVARNDS